jgi:hypothetical protein
MSDAQMRVAPATIIVGVLASVRIESARLHEKIERTVVPWRSITNDEESLRGAFPHD